MKDYIDKMLHLTADIAEELLTLKDTGKDIDQQLSDKIAKLARLASDNVMPYDEPIAKPEETPELEVTTEQTFTEPEPINKPEEEPEPESLETPEAVDTPEITYEIENIQEKTPIEITYDTIVVDDKFEDVSVELTPVEDTQEYVEELEYDKMPEPVIVSTNFNNETATITEPVIEDEDINTEPECDTEAIAESALKEEAEDANEVSVEYHDDEDEPIVREPLYTAAEIRNAFTLNDVFLYQRTLFGGSPQRFKDTLHFIADSYSLAEVEDYLVHTQRVNLESDEAKDFLGIIAPFFN